jgi:type II secretory pathway pseudopilin PulG
MIGNKVQANRKYSFGGFTAIELLVVILIFSMGSIMVTSTYINLTRLHRRASNAEALGEDLRYMMELMTRATRNYRVSYATNPVSAHRTSIDLLNSAGNRVSFAWSDEDNSYCENLNVETGCLTMYVEGVTADYIPLSSKNVDILDFAVYTTPTADPFTPISLGVYANDRQPIVTYFIKARYHATNQLEETVTSVQVSVGSRVYVR